MIVSHRPVNGTYVIYTQIVEWVTHSFLPRLPAYFATSDLSLVSDTIEDEASHTLGYQRSNDINTWFDDECVDATNWKNETRNQK